MGERIREERRSREMRPRLGREYSDIVEEIEDKETLWPRFDHDLPVHVTAVAYSILESFLRQKAGFPDKTLGARGNIFTGRLSKTRASNSFLWVNVIASS